MESSSSVSPKLLRLQLALLLLLFAPVQQLQGRELGGSTQAQHAVGVPSSLVLALPTSGGGGDGGGGDGDGAAVNPPEKLNAPPGVSRPGGLAPPSPTPGYSPQPGQEPSQAVVVSSPGGVAGDQPKLAPPPPVGNPPSNTTGSLLGPEAADM